MILLPTLLVAGLPIDAISGAWTRPEGEVYGRVSINRYVSTEEFDAERERQEFLLDGEFRDLNVAGYVEYGLSERFTAIASLTVKDLRNENDVRITKSWGIGDIDAAVRTRLAQGSVGVTALQLLAKIPSAYDAGDDVALPLGNGEFEFDARLQYGRSLWPVAPGYGGLELGYRWRNGRPTDEVRYLAELGSDVGGGFYVRGKLDGTRGRRTGTRFDTSGNPTVRNSADLGALDLTAGRRFGARVSVEAGYAKGLYGRNTPAGSTATLAVAYSGPLGGD